MRDPSIGATRRGRTVRLLALGAVACAAIGAASAFGATADTPYDVLRVDSPDPQFTGQFGSRLAVGDATGDGVQDVWATSGGQQVGGVKRAGAVSLINGATREIVYTVSSPDVPIQANLSFGFEITGLDDINGDGLDDLGVGSGRQNVDGNAGQGRYYVFDGRTGNLEYFIDNPDPQPSARFGDYASSAGDVTRDGVPDILVSAVANDMPAGCGSVPAANRPPDCRVNEGQTYTFDGRDGSLVRTFNIPEEDRPGPECNNEVQVGGANFNVCGSNGFAPRSPGDMTGDGVPEAMVPAGSLRPDGDRTRQGRIYIFDGANGEVLIKIDQPAGDDPDTLWGFNDIGRFTPGDLNADGVPEIYGTGIRVDGPNGEVDAGRVYIFDGKRSLAARRGVVLFELQNPTPEPAEAFGFPADKTDYNKDGTPDLYVGANAGGTGETFVFDGRDGSLLKTLAVPADEVQPREAGNGNATSLTTRALGDLNGDGEPDYVGGAGGQDVNGRQDQGRLFFFQSNVPGPPPGGPPPGGGPPAGAGPCGQPGGAGYLNPAKMRVSRARVLREDRELDVLAPITTRARGADVSVTYQGDGRSDTFDAKVTNADSALDEIRVRESITRGQARLGTGIVNLTYQGDADTRPELVRLRAASQRAELDVDEISLIGDRLSGQGSVTSRAEGVVRLRYSYVDPDGSPNVHLAQAEIDEDGDWELENDQVPSQLAQCGGYLSIQFTGYFERRIRGEQLAYELNAGQTRTP